MEPYHASTAGWRRKARCGRRAINWGFGSRTRPCASSGLLPVTGVFVALGAAWAFQRPFREYPGQEYKGFEIPPGANEHTEFVMGRLAMFPRVALRDVRHARSLLRLAREGNTGWTNDYPRADRHFVQAVEGASRASRCAPPSSPSQSRRRRRRLRLALDLRGAGIAHGPHSRAGEKAARISAARRISDDRGHLGQRSMGPCRRQLQARISRTRFRSRFQTGTRSST